MRRFALLCSFVSVAIQLQSFTPREQNIQDLNAPRSKLSLGFRIISWMIWNPTSDPGPPLGPDDFFLASQLGRARTNETSLGMMLPPRNVRQGGSALDQDLVMENKELQGAETEARQSRYAKNGLSKLTWDYWDHSYIILFIIFIICHCISNIGQKIPLAQWGCPLHYRRGLHLIWAGSDC